MYIRFTILLFCATVCYSSSLKAETPTELQCNPVPKRNLVCGITFGAGTVVAATAAVLFWAWQPNPAIAGADFDYAFAKMFAPVLTGATVALGVVSAVHFARYKRLNNKCKGLTLAIKPDRALLVYDF